MRAINVANRLGTGKTVVKRKWEKVSWSGKMGENMAANSSFYAPLEFPFSAVPLFGGSVFCHVGGIKFFGRDYYTKGREEEVKVVVIPLKFY